MNPDYGYSVNHDDVNEGMSDLNDNVSSDMVRLRDEIAISLQSH